MREVSGHPHIDLVAGCDVRADARSAFSARFGGAVYDSVEALAASPDVDAVYVATPNHLHRDHALAAIAQGKDVIVEKPIALDLAECDDIIRASHAAGVRVLAGHTHSFDAPIMAMSDVIRSGGIGQLYMINQWHYTDWLYRGRLLDELDVAKGGGVVLRQGPHGVDILRLLAAEPLRRVRAQVTQLDQLHPAPGSYCCFLEFDSVVATLVFSGYAFFDSTEYSDGIGEDGRRRQPRTHASRRALVTQLGSADAESQYKASMRMGGQLEGHWMRLEGDDPRVVGQPHYGVTVASGSAGDLRQSADGLVLDGPGGRVDIDVPRGALEREAELNVLYDAWRADEPLASHDAVWARGTLEACLAIAESSRTGEAVTLTGDVQSLAGAGAGSRDGGSGRS